MLSKDQRANLVLFGIVKTTLPFTFHILFSRKEKKDRLGYFILKDTLYIAQGMKAFKMDIDNQVLIDFFQTISCGTCMPALLHYTIAFSPSKTAQDQWREELLFFQG